MAVGQLAGEGGVLQGGLAPGQVPGFPGGFPGAGGGQRLVEDGPRRGGIFLQVGHQVLVEHGADQRAHLRVAQLRLGLALELGLLQLDADDAGQALPHVLAGEVLVVLLEDVVLVGIVVHHPGEGALKAVLVGAAVGGADVVGKAENLLLVGVGVLQGHFRGGVLVLGHGGEVDDIRVQHVLAGVDVLHKGADAALIAVVVLVGDFPVPLALRPVLGGALVGELDMHPGV